MFKCRNVKTEGFWNQQSGLGILKYSTVLAKAKEFGGIVHTSDLISMQSKPNKNKA